MTDSYSYYDDSKDVKNILNSKGLYQTTQSSLLGSLLCYGEYFKESFEEVDLELHHFPNELDKKIFQILKDLAKEGVIELDHNYIAKKANIETFTVLAYASQNSLSTSLKASVEIIKREYLQNTARMICQNAFLELSKNNCEPQDIISDVLVKLENLQKSKYGTIQKVVEILAERNDYIEKIQSSGSDEAGRFVQFGVEKLDNFLGKYSMPGGGDLITIAAGTGSGKTTLGIQSICQLQKLQKKGLVINLEMSKFTLTNKIISILSNIPLDTVEELQKPNPNPNFTEKMNRDKYNEFLGKVIDIDVHITDGISKFDDIIGAIKTYKRKYEIDYVLLDYIQLVEASATYKSENGSYDRIGFMTKTLKLLAKKLDIPIFMLSQLSKDGNIAESQKIMHDSDLVIFLKRDEVTNLTTISIKKDRKRGKLGDITVPFNPLIQIFK